MWKCGGPCKRFSQYRQPCCRVGWVGVALGTALLLSPPSADAVASFARQTGLPCSSCHITYPELTPFGRLFKLNGYTITGLPQVEEKGGPTKAALNISNFLPLSAFLQVSHTSTSKPQTGSQNGTFEFPQSASLFLAGAMATHIGGLIQVTYNAQKDHFSWDNTDVRYADRTKVLGKEVIYGVTFNNNPSVEDLWSSTPAWGFPWVSPDSTPKPLAATVVDGTLAQDVAGLGVFAMWNQHLYGAATVYRSDHLGSLQPISGSLAAFNIRGVAPYWRLAWQQTVGNNYLEVGGYGMRVNSSPGTILGPTDSYTDIAADLQYERILPTVGNDVVTVHSTFIHQNSSLNATLAAGGAAVARHHLDSFRADGTFHFGNKYAPSLGYFTTEGTADTALFAPVAVSGSANGSPKSDGYIAQFSYWPVQNVQLALQYKGYSKFNGAGTNYDGLNRNASGNNSLYLMVWFNF